MVRALVSCMSIINIHFILLLVASFDDVPCQWNANISYHSMYFWFKSNWSYNPFSSLLQRIHLIITLPFLATSDTNIIILCDNISHKQLQEIFICHAATTENKAKLNSNTIKESTGTSIMKVFEASFLGLQHFMHAPF